MSRQPRSLLTSLTLTRETGAALPRQGGVWASHPSGAAPLTGLRVLELGSYTAGPLAGRLLAQLGAAVLKVEPPKGEGSRRLAQQVGSVGYLYFVNNAGKQACLLDLTKAADRATYDRLEADADVVLTNLAVDTLAATGLDAASVTTRRDLVHCTISGYGVAEPGRSFDTVIQAEAGMMAAIGATVGEPRRTAISAVDVLGAYLGASAVALATLARLRTGAGGSLDVALLDVARWVVQEASDPSSVAELRTSSAGLTVIDRTIQAPVRDLTSVLGDPQVRARRMLTHHAFAGTDLLVTGNHLRSLLNPSPELHLAPADQNRPWWPDSAEQTASPGTAQLSGGQGPDHTTTDQERTP